MNFKKSARKFVLKLNLSIEKSLHKINSVAAVNKIQKLEHQQLVIKTFPPLFFHAKNLEILIYKTYIVVCRFVCMSFKLMKGFVLQLCIYVVKTLPVAKLYYYVS